MQRIGGIAEDVTEAKLAAVLPAELQHRVRNIMAQILPFTARTGERAESAYDEGVIPAAYVAVPRLQKPVRLKQVVNTLAAAPGVAG